MKEKTQDCRREVGLGHGALMGPSYAACCAYLSEILQLIASLPI